MAKKNDKKTKEYRAKFVPRKNIPSKEAGIFQDMIALNTFKAMKKSDGEEMTAGEFERLFPYLAEFVRDMSKKLV